MKKRKATGARATKMRNANKEDEMRRVLEELAGDLAYDKQVETHVATIKQLVKVNESVFIELYNNIRRALIPVEDTLQAQSGLPPKHAVALFATALAVVANRGVEVATPHDAMREAVYHVAAPWIAKRTVDVLDDGNDDGENTVH